MPLSARTRLLSLGVSLSSTHSRSHAPQRSLTLLQLIGIIMVMITSCTRTILVLTAALLVVPGVFTGLSAAPHQDGRYVHLIGFIPAESVRGESMSNSSDDSSCSSASNFVRSSNSESDSHAASGGGGVSVLFVSLEGGGASSDNHSQTTNDETSSSTVECRNRIASLQHSTMHMRTCRCETLTAASPPRRLQDQLSSCGTEP